MSKNLVIVESPAKAKTIEKFLGKDYYVMSSFGHVRDLADKGIGIDFENNYQPQYIVSPDIKKVVSELKKAVKDAEWCGSLPMKTAKERPLLGICMMSLS